jgi:hypothetical protein
MTHEFAITHFIKSTSSGSRLLWWCSVLMAIGMLICFVLPFYDLRLISGVSVWEKPAKFFLSFIVQALTLSWAISLLRKQARGVQTATWLFVAALTLEMSYMIYRASLGEASHFNNNTPFAAIMYGVMGIAALILTCTSAFIGWRVWQNRGLGVMRSAAGMGLTLGAALATFAGAYLSSYHGHWIGGDQTDATGLAFFHWSTTGGDLRVPHFIGLHAAQFIPLSALSGSNRIVNSTAVAVIFVFALTMFMAIAGMPLFSSASIY